MACSPPGSSVLGIFQARILECLPFPTLEDLPNPGMKPVAPVSALAGRFSTTEPPGKPKFDYVNLFISSTLFSILRASQGFFMLQNERKLQR